MLAVEWLDTSLLVAGGCPLGIDGEEFEGGITTIDGLVCDECNKGKKKRIKLRFLCEVGGGGLS